MTETLHYSCVAMGGRGVLIGGPSGSGKSDLALRLIDRGAMLVSDDYTVLEQRDGALIATAPTTIAGRIEVRGIGILRLPHAVATSVVLVVKLTTDPDRLPAPAIRRIAGLDIPEVAVDARSASAAIKVELALAHFAGRA